MRYRALFFDVDDTLYPYGTAYTAAFDRAVGPHCRGGRPPAAVRVAADPAWDPLWASHLRREIDEDALRQSWGACVLAAAGADAPAPDLIRSVMAHQDALIDEACVPFPDVPPALAALAAARPRPVLGIISNAPAAVQRRRLVRLGLADRFEVVVLAGAVGLEKPDVAIYREALRLAGVDPGQAVMIGDNPRADAAGARAAGLASVWLNRGGARWPAGLRPEPDLIAPDLTAVARWLLQAPGM